MKPETLRHSYAHILALAVKEIYPKAKFGMGPVTGNGFYYDFEFKTPISSDDLPKIEKQMKQLIKEGQKFEKEEVSTDKALKIFKDLKQSYKVELIKDLKKEGAKKVTVYKSGEFTDLCKGPHVKSTRQLNPEAFKLTSLAGAYWKGDEKKAMLDRIYGVAFETKGELDDYLENLKKAQEIDHRKLGKELDLFVFSDLVGPGLPLFTPKGMVIIDELKKQIEAICRNYGFEKVMTPHLAKIKLFELSGHAKKFKEELFMVSSERGHEFAMKPVQCPHQTQIYASKTRSYRDLPIRYMESEKQYRAEKSGEVGGLNRVYAITIEDGHSFCTIDQVKDEIKRMVNIIKEFYDIFGLWGSHWVSLSLRDYADPEKYIGEPKEWDECEKMLKEVSDEMGLDAKKVEGEAALYGPKLDFMFKDALGREIQIPTVQLDFATPKRFDLTYVNEEGKEIHPVMVHRAVIGSYERFLALLIEYFAGAFPLWLAPVQVRVIPVSEKVSAYGKKVMKQIEASGFRVEIDDGDETLGKKIRLGQMQKIPYLLIVGEKEAKNQSVAVRNREKGDLGEMAPEQFIEKISKIKSSKN